MVVNWTFLCSLSLILLMMGFLRIIMYFSMWIWDCVFLGFGLMGLVGLLLLWMHIFSCLPRFVSWVGWTQVGLCLIGMLSPKLYTELVGPPDGWWCLPLKSLICWARILTKKVTVDKQNQCHRLELITMNFTFTRTYNDDNT